MKSLYKQKIDEQQNFVLKNQNIVLYEYVLDQ